MTIIKIQVISSCITIIITISGLTTRRQLRYNARKQFLYLECVHFIYLSCILYFYSFKKCSIKSVIHYFKLCKFYFLYEERYCLQLSLLWLHTQVPFVTIQYTFSTFLPAWLFQVSCYYYFVWGNSTHILFYQHFCLGTFHDSWDHVHDGD